MKIMKTIKNLRIFLMLAGIVLLGAQSLWAVDFISAISAHTNAKAGTGVIIDVRTVEEHQGCNATWTGTFAGCPTTELENRGAPAWTDTASGVQMQSINIPYWINSTASDTLPQDTTEFGDSFQALLDSGYVTTSTPIYLLCRSGYRSYYGGVYIEANGLNFTNVYSVDGAGVAAGGSGTGGMLEWTGAGLPVPWIVANDRGWKAPQVLSITPTAGYTSITNSVDFTVGILEPTWGDTGGVMYYTAIERFSLYIDGVETEFITSDPTIGLLWTTSTFNTTLANGTYTWDIRAESQNRSDETNDASNLISWNPNADLIGPGNRSITVNGPDISVEPTDLNVGAVVGNTTTTPVTVSNDGGANLLIGTLSISGGEFSTQNDNCSNQTVAAGNNCTVEVVFAPLSEGVQTGYTLDIPSNDTDPATATVSLTGDGTANPEANIQVSSSSVDFGSVTVGSTSSPQTITVTSSGTADLDIGTITVTGDFSIQNDLCSSQTVAFGGSTCTFDVVFSPSSEGALAGSISIPSNDPDGDESVSLSGTGTAPPDIEVTPASVSFDSLAVQATSSAQFVRIQNTGTADLIISSMALSSTTDFSLDTGDGANNTCGAAPTISASGFCNVSVTFQPLSAGDKSITLDIASNDPDEATLSVSLSGTGVTVPVVPADGTITGPELVSPVNGCEVSSAVTFKWRPFTDAVSYEVYYCKNQDFSGADSGCSGATTIEVSSLARNGVYFYAGSGLAVILFSLMFMGGIRGRRKLMLFAIAVMISSTMFIVSCKNVDDEPGDDNTDTFTDPVPDNFTTKGYYVSGLEAGATYYWGVVAVDADGNKTPSTVWSFSVESGTDAGGY